MYSKNGGNIGSPGHYKWQVCLTETNHTAFRQRCQGSENRIISMYQRNDSHASSYGDYKWSVCVPDISTSFNQTCSNAIASMKFRDNSHLGGPDHFKWKICPTVTKQPDNTTLQMNLDSGSTVFIDDVNTLGPVKVAEYPYIVRENPPYLRGIVSYNMLSTSSSSDKRRLEITASADNSEYLLPFTEADHQDVENREEKVLNRELLNLVDPSFGPGISSQSTVKVALKTDYPTYGFSGQERNFLDIAVRNRFDGDNTTDIEFKPR